MTYRIVQLHGGEMEVRSNAEVGAPERGTTFTLSILVSVAPMPVGPIATVPALAATAVEGRGADAVEATDSGLAKGMD
jgi:hypothetical protein